MYYVERQDFSTTLRFGRNKKRDKTDFVMAAKDIKSYENTSSNYTKKHYK